MLDTDGGVLPSFLGCAAASPYCNSSESRYREGVTVIHATLEHWQELTEANL